MGFVAVVASRCAAVRKGGTPLAAHEREALFRPTAGVPMESEAQAIYGKASRFVQTLLIRLAPV